MDLQQLLSEITRSQQGTPEIMATILGEAILRGIFQVRQPLHQEEIASHLGVSRLPKREALRPQKSRHVTSSRRER